MTTIKQYSVLAKDDVHDKYTVRLNTDDYDEAEDRANDLYDAEDALTAVRDNLSGRIVYIDFYAVDFDAYERRFDTYSG